MFAFFLKPTCSGLQGADEGQLVRGGGFRQGALMLRPESLGREKRSHGCTPDSVWPKAALVSAAGRGEVAPGASAVPPEMVLGGTETRQLVIQ